MPFANYKDFDTCVKANSGKKNPQAYCAEIKRKTEDKSKQNDAIKRNKA